MEDQEAACVCVCARACVCVYVCVCVCGLPVRTIFSLKYRTAKNNSKWECPEKFRELSIIEPKCPV